MANPRKFSDKLEIIRRKEEEANAAFVQIMREVTDARKGSHVSSRIGSHQPNAWIHNSNEYMKMRQKYKGGSLPNVSLSPNPSVNLQQNLYGVNDAYGQPTPQPTYGGIPSGGGHLRRNMEPPAGPIFPSRNKYRSYTVTSPYRSNLIQQPSLIEENEAPSLWRRTYSDSAIQQTLQLPPKSNINGSSSSLQNVGATRIPTNPNQQLGNSEGQTFSRSLSNSGHLNCTSSKNNLNIQADTSSLPDLSNLSIPSPIQTPIDAAEQDSKNNVKQVDPSNHFSVPYRIPTRRSNFNKPMYARHADGAGSDIIDQKPSLNLFPEINVCNATVSGANSSSIMSHSAPISPVTPPSSYFWGNPPISPLAATEMRHSASSPAANLQQQLFQLQNENLRNNGINHPPPYFSNDEESFTSHCTNNFVNHKQNLCRVNTGPSSVENSKSLWDQPLEAALMQVKAEQTELSQADLNSVAVALDPLDFNDVQMLADQAQIVDQASEEQFRLERASYI